MATVAGGDHAVEQIDPHRHRVHDVDGFSETHQVAGCALLEFVVGAGDRIPAFCAFLTEAESAVGVAVEADVPGQSCALPAPLFRDASLHDSKHRLLFVLAGLGAAFRPAQGAVERRFEGGFDLRAALGCVAVGERSQAFVEHHRDITAEGFLDPDHALRGQQPPGAVQRGGERHSLVGHRDPMRQGRHLETTAVRQPGTLPTREAVQAAQTFDDRLAGSFVEVIGVGQQDLRPEVHQVVGRHPAHRAKGCNAHEGRGLDGSVRRRELSAAGRAIARFAFE